MAEAGSHVIVHGRRQNRCLETVKDIHRHVPHAKLDYLVADLSVLEHIPSLREKLQGLTDHLDVLINNAGVGPGQHGQERELSGDGYELRFAVNHLAPFVLTWELLPLLRAAKKARIVNVSSAAQSPINFEDPMLERDFDPMRAYAQSKLAAIMFTVSLAEQLQNEGITVNALHPGSLLDTKMVRETFGSARGSAETGAKNEVYLASRTEVEGVTGAYFYERQQRRAHDQAYDPEARERLWRLSEELTGITFDTGSKAV
jgi:NAD(P)-dependent dehydrogenase (short-subunit alcohol dehydrogenase family)